ncbi:MAG: acyl-CoA thioesterase [Sulfolobaceae archaeon]|nr:acyl-CoA thioesterase [Stygiolobus sp.]
MSSLRISDTKVTSLRVVHYENSNFMGRLHGGDMLNFLVDTGMLSAMKVANGLAVLASLDDVVFKKPVLLGDIIEVEAQVEYIGNTSMEVTMRAKKGSETLVEASGVYVKVDDLLRPSIITARLNPNEEEKLIYEKALERRKNRAERIKDRLNKRYDVSDPTEGLRYRITTTIYVTPEMTYDGKIISAGKLLKVMDDLGGSLALRYIGYEGYKENSSTVVTVSANSMSFYTPVRLGDILEIRAGITYVGNTSIETVINVIRIDPKSQVKEHVTTAYFNYVRVDYNGKPTKVQPYTPQTEKEKKAYEDALIRRRKLLSLS